MDTVLLLNEGTVIRGPSSVEENNSGDMLDLKPVGSTDIQYNAL